MLTTILGIFISLELDNEVFLIAPNVIRDSLERFLVQHGLLLCTCQCQRRGHDVADLAPVKTCFGHFLLDPFFNTVGIVEAVFVFQWLEETVENGDDLIWTELGVFDCDVNAGLNGYIELGDLVGSEHQNS